MKQLDYMLEQSDEERQKQFLDCIRSCLEKRSRYLGKDVWTEYLKNERDIVDSFQNAFLTGMEQLHDIMTSGKKQAISYIQISYLLSTALSGEKLIKIDFYDRHYYGDIYEADCFWDYGKLFPEYKEELILLKKELQQVLPRITSYEFQKASTYYQIGNFIVLETVVKDMLYKIKPEELPGKYLAANGGVFYGAYLDQSEMIYKWGSK
ncbi:MAG: hypothetical protein ACLT46_13320 [Hungatella sp.]